jgi:GT2 family glycosyltransferase
MPVDVLVVVNDGRGVVDGRDGATMVRTRGWEGLAAAREMGTRRAIESGAEVIGYVDDDDELLPNHIELVGKEVESGAAFAFSRAVFRYANGDETEDPEPDNHDPNKRYYDPTALLRQNIAPVSSYMHSSSAYERVGGWDRRILRMEDWDLWGRMFIEFGPPVHVPVVTNAIYRGHGPNLTTSSPFGYSMCCSWRDLVEDRLRYLSSLGRGLTGEALCRAPSPPVPHLGVVFCAHSDKNLRESMDGIMEQTYRDFEVLAIAAGPGVRPALEWYACNFGNVRIFDAPDNPVKAMNLGLLVSRSEYVALARTEAHPETLARHVSYLEENRTVGAIVDGPISTMRRRVIEVVGGLSECEYPEVDLWGRASKKFAINNVSQVL